MEFCTFSFAFSVKKQRQNSEIKTALMNFKHVFTQSSQSQINPQTFNCK